MKYQPFAFLTIALAIGVVMASRQTVSDTYLLSVAGLILALILIMWWGKKLTQSIPLLGLILVCIVGMLRYQQVYQVNLPQEFSSHKQLLALEVTDIYKPSSQYYKYKANILKAADSTLIAQNILLYLKKTQPSLHLQDVVLTNSRVSIIEPPKNPHQFNYKKFIAHKGIYIQSFTDTIFYTKHPSNFKYAHEVSVFKDKIKQGLDLKGYGESAQIFIAALALGDRTDFTQNIQQTLSAAGVMHLFAISGLHIGIVFWLILWLLYPLLYFPHGRKFRVIMALILIWLFASFVNFTPSVTRAAFMISFYYITFLLQRPTQIFHTLFFTAFVLLLIQPNQLFDVGFQLSYAAVFFIAWLYQPIRQLFPRHRKRIQNYVYDLLSVTIAAQMGVMPIALFYFNQFSAMFIIGNLLLIPLALFLVGISGFTVMLINFNLDFSWYIQGVNFLFNFIYGLIETIGSVEGLIFRQISISIFQLCILTGIMILLKPLLVGWQWVKTIPILALLLLLQSTRIYDEHTSQDKKELIVFHLYQGSMVGIRDGKNLNVFQSTKDTTRSFRYVIKPYVLKEKIDSIAFWDLNKSIKTKTFIKENNWIKWHDKQFYIAHQKTDSIPAVEHIIATKGSIDANTHIPQQTKRVIADGSNYPSVVKRLKENSDKVYSTAHKGAFIFTTDSINR